MSEATGDIVPAEARAAVRLPTMDNPGTNTPVTMTTDVVPAPQPAGRPATRLRLPVHAMRVRRARHGRRSRCPECGLRTYWSLRAPQSLAEYPVEWVVTMARAVPLLAIAYAGLGLLMLAGFLNLLDGNAWAAPIGFAVAGGLQLVALWMLSRRSGHWSEPAPPLNRWTLRIAAVGPAVSGAAGLFIAATRQAPRWLELVLLVGMAGWVFAAPAAFVRIRAVARMISDSRLAAQRDHRLGIARIDARPGGPDHGCDVDRHQCAGKPPAHDCDADRGDRPDYLPARRRVRPDPLRVRLPPRAQAGTVGRDAALMTASPTILDDHDDGDRTAPVRHVHPLRLQPPRAGRIHRPLPGVRPESVLVVTCAANLRHTRRRGSGGFARDVAAPGGVRRELRVPGGRQLLRPEG